MGNICKSFVDTKNVGTLTKVNKLKELMIGLKAMYALESKDLEEKLEAIGVNTTHASVVPSVTPVVPEVTPSTPLVQANPTNPIVAAGSAIIGQDITQPLENKANDVVVNTPTAQNLNAPVIDMPTVQPATVPVNTVPLQMEETDKSIENVINEQVAPVLDDNNQSLSTPQEVAQPENIVTEVQAPVVNKVEEVQNSVLNDIPKVESPIQNTVEPKVEEVVTTPEPIVASVPTAPVPDPFVEAVSEIEKVRSEFNDNCGKVSTYLEQLKTEMNNRLNEISRRAEAQRQTFEMMNKQVNVDNNAINASLQNGIQNLNNNQTIAR